MYCIYIHRSVQLKRFTFVFVFFVTEYPIKYFDNIAKSEKESERYRKITMINR